MTALPLLVYWGIALPGLFARRPVLVWLFFGCLPFGAMAVIPAAVTGGLTLTGAHMTAMLLIVRQFLLHRDGGAQPGAQVFSRSGFLLALFCAYALLVSLFAPQVFAGQIDVVPVFPGAFMQTELLRPPMQNFSQLAYMTVSVFAVFAFASLFRAPERRDLLRGGVMLASTLTVVTGLLDIFRLEVLPEPFRTASYALLVDVHLDDGARRVTGAMIEASSFGTLSLTLLACLWFLRRSITDPVQARLARILLVGLAFLLVLSTSPAVHVGIAVLLMVMAGQWFARCSDLMQRGLRGEFLLVVAVLSLAVAVLPVAPILVRLGEMVFSNGESLSYPEHSMWTHTSLNAGMESWMIGPGPGSVWVSGFAAALFGSTGLIGVLLYFGFVLQRITRRVPADVSERNRAIAAALKWPFFPPFAISVMISTTPDFGVFNAMRWGMSRALARARVPDIFSAVSPATSLARGA